MLPLSSTGQLSLDGQISSTVSEAVPPFGQAASSRARVRSGRGNVIITAASTRSRRERKGKAEESVQKLEKILGSRIARHHKHRQSRSKEQNNNPDALVAALRSGSDIGLDATSSGVMEIVQTSRLLNLPPEIRNEIWRLSVRVPNQLIIMDDAPKQPAITRTCRQIRAESIRYFYRENSFTCTIVNYNPTNFKEYRKFADKHGLSTVLLTHRHSVDATRDLLRANFLAWVEGTFKGETAPLGYSAGHTEETFVWEKLSHRIVKVFNIARELRKTSIDWEPARTILLAAIDAAGVCGEKKK